ncbi:MAG: ferritin-like domain-containing protein [Halanaerobiales bacterium]
MSKNVFDFALEFEKEHRSFYEDLYDKTENRSLKKVFKDLAEQEKKHEEVVLKLQQKEEVNDIESNILPVVKETFDKIASGLPESVLPDDQVEIYKKAREMEERTHKFYLEKAEDVESNIKKVFLKLAAEEKKHENILSNLIEFVNKPNTWLDDAEWYHLEDY